MLTTTTTLSAQGSSKDPETQQEILSFEARIEYDGRVNIYKSCPNRKLYNENKETADADYTKFEAYANALFDKITLDTITEE